MKFKKLLESLDFDLGNEEKRELKIKVKRFVELLRKEVSKAGVNAEIFVGGSFAKGTLMKSEEHDIDIFVRFKEEEDLSGKLRKILRKTNVDFETVHGSRDYFKILKGDVVFEIVPVKKIRKIDEAENVADLSYFHVNYVKKNLTDDKRRDVRLAKRFCKTLGVYGAETYIGGFSGYSLECLIIYFGGFEKMIKELAKVKEELVLDPEKYYKTKEEALIEINESKRQGPLVLIDPTWKERNVLAGLSWESFERFKRGCEELLKSPSKEMFEIKKFDAEEFKNFREKTNGEFVHIVLETDRQEGDIAGTKMKRFARYLIDELEMYFEILKEEFVYSGGKTAEFYLVVKSRKEVVKRGPLLVMKQRVEEFKRRNKNVFEEKERIWAVEKIDFSAREFLERINRGKMLEMGVLSMRVLKKN